MKNVKLEGGYLYYSIGEKNFCLLPMLSVMEYRDLGVINLERINNSFYTDSYGNDESDYDYEDKNLSDLTIDELEDIIMYEMSTEQEIEEIL
jgi:hypothetical protein